jgi:S1-C subfamily serine protease
MVSYVYADSPAARAGIGMGAILVRLHAEGMPKPVEVKIEKDGYSGGMEFPWDQLDQVPAQYLDQMPKPWPGAENSFTRALTNLGFGKKFTADFYIDGKKVIKDFVVEEGPKHYDSAKRFKSETLGLTVRDLTYEVRRYFQRTEADGGVIVSKIESGSKAAVAGIKPYEIVTRVNEQPVKSVDDFEKMIAGQDQLRITLKRMTRGRVVKIKMASAAAG